ncbi:MAG: hypothetical protein ABI679_04850 [Gemmatimonadota bacterium]
MRRSPLYLTAALLIPSIPLAAQETHVQVRTVPAQAADVATLDGIIGAFYDVISGPAGQPRQWSRDRSLYIPDVRFVSMDIRNGKPVASITSHQQFVDHSDAQLVKEGFFETEIHRTTRRFGNTDHIMSTYDMKDGAGKPLGRGVNSIQLFWDGNRWWISGVAWDDERPDNPIPPELLPD